MAHEFQVDLKRGAGHAVLHVAGDLDLATAEIMELFLEEAQDSPGLIVDVRGVGCADSSGIRVLVETARRMEDRGCDFRISGAGPRVSRAFNVLGLDDLLEPAPAKVAAGDVAPDPEEPARLSVPIRRRATAPPVRPPRRRGRAVGG